MRKEMIQRKAINEKGNTCPNEPDQLNMWECTSMNDIKPARKLRFILGKSTEKLKIEDNAALNQTAVRCSNNRYYLGNQFENLLLGLSRLQYDMFALDKSDEIFSVISHEQLKETMNRSELKKVKILLYSRPQRIENPERKNEIISLYHNTPCGGHFGVTKTLKKIRQKYIWKNMYKTVKEYVRKCDLCQRNKQVRHTKEPLCVTDTPTQSCSTIVIDTVGPLRPSGNYRYILTMQCELTKYVIACPMYTKEAKSIAKALVENAILKYGLFKILKSDRGTEFTNELMKEICEMLKIEQKFSTPYHHETLGTIERNHRVLNEYFLSFVTDDNWEQWIPYYTFAYNITPHVDTNYSPFELIFGKIPSLPGDDVANHPQIYNLENYANEIKTRLRYSIQNARNIIEKVKQNRQLDSNKKTNSIEIEIGDLVLVKVENRRKNESPYIGPYEVIDIDNPNVTISKKKINAKYCTKTNLRNIQCNNNP